MVRVQQSTVIDAPIGAVWHLLRDFNSHRDWHPAIADSTMEDRAAPDQVGGVRRFQLQDGGELAEQLLSLSDRDHHLRYCLQSTPIPLQGYVAEIQLKPVTDSDQTFWQWSSKFDTPPGREQELKALVEQQIYQAGFTAIATRLGRGRSTEVTSPMQPATPVAGEHPAPIRIFGYPDREATKDRADSLPTAAADTTGAIVVDRHGGPEEMIWREVPLAMPGPGEVQILHHAIGVNYIDVYCRTGYFNFLKPPGGLGMEAAGEVVAIGDGAGEYRVGDRVAYAAPPVGAYARRRNMAHQALVRLPDHVDYDTAAAVMLKGMAAEFLLHRVYRLQQGDTILVHAAAGGVGLLLCQWASAMGATVIGSVSGDEKAALAAANGCTHPVIHNRQDLVSRVMEITGDAGVDAVFDAIGRSTFGRSMEALKTCGHLVSFGQAGEPLGEWDLGDFAARSMTLSRPNFGNYTDTPEKRREISENLFRALDAGIVRSHIGQRFALSRAAEAHHALENRRTTGSTILIPDQ